MTPNELVNAIRVAASSGDFDEQPKVLVFFSHLDEPSQRELWDNLRVSPPTFISEVYISNADNDAVFNSYADPIRGERFRITLHKRIVEGELRLFFSKSISRNVDSLQEVNSVLIAEMGATETFGSHFARYQHWSTEPIEIYAPIEPLTDPRRYVRDFSASRVVPNDIRHWLLRAPPSAIGDAFREWEELASLRLFSALADQVSETDDQVVFNFSGPPTQKISVDGGEIKSASSGLQAAAKWVFLEGKDVDTRHMLFANEIARSYRAGELGSTCPQALESAQAAYSAYVKAGSRETLKALADLRKAVIEETQKISQKSQELAAGLWKDIPVAAAPFILKLFADSAKISNATVAGVLAFLAACFLSISYSMQVFINARFFKHQDDSRAVWRKVLCTTLSNDELQQISELPIAGCKSDYKRVRNFVGFIYFLLCVGLLFFCYVELRVGGDAPPSTVENKPAEAPKVDSTVKPAGRSK